jgi:hypothetical protein
MSDPGDLRRVFDRMIDELGRWSKIDVARNELAKTRSDIRRLGTVCGDCDNWMKSKQCPKDHNIRGRNHGPSCNTPVLGCSSYSEAPKVEHRRVQLTLESERLRSIIEQEAGDE